jgi:chromosome segregation protein
MYLKCIEIQGFKSFAERVKIEFEKGITVVVGPNGCGKSNLTDAVYWALGEQSARSLRGYKMDDVIFSGTSKRRPHGMAQVTLTFDNSDRVLPLPYEEISITRRVYRSGEGEYYINKKICRLRDIQELFAQCGISRAAFSITSQGKVDEFILVRPRERRIFVEDIAGVSSYRQRKSNALKRLQETEDSLQRLDDLLVEMEKRRLPLKKQAELAERYQRFAREHQEVESRFLESQLATARKKEEELLSDSQELESSLKQYQKIITILEQQLVELRQGMSGHLTTIEHKEKDLIEIQRELQEDHSALVRLEEKLGSYGYREEDLQTRLAVIEQRKAETEHELKEVMSACQKLMDDQSQAKREVEKLMAEKGDWEEQKQETNRSWETVDREIFSVLHKKTALVSDLQVLKNKKEVLVRQQESLAQKINKGKVRYQELKTKLQSCEELYEQHAVSQDNLKQELEGEEKVLQLLAEEKEKNSSDMQSLVQKINKLQVRLQVLRDTEDRQEGYQYGVKRILKELAKGVRFDGDVLFLVEELLDVPSSYETALDIALGRAAHHFICNTPKAAQEAIAFLKEKKAGRASFLPLTALEHWNSKDRDNAVMVEGVVGRLSELVICEERYEKLAEYLLGRTYLADNLRSASIFAEKNNYRYRVVTVDGELIHSGGLFTGGSGPSHYPSTRRRKKEIKELETQIDKEGHTLVSYQQQEKKLDAELAQAIKKVDELRKRVKQIEYVMKEDLSRLNAWKQELKQLAESNEGYQLEGNELFYQEQDYNQQIGSLEQELELISIREGEVEDSRAKLESIRRAAEEKNQQLMSRLSDAQVLYSRISQNLKHEEQKGEQLQQLMELRRQELLKMKNDLTALKGEKENNQKQEWLLRQDMDAKNKLKEELNEIIAAVKNKAAARERYIAAKEKRCFKLKGIETKLQQRLQNNNIKLQHIKELNEQIYNQAEQHNIELNQINENKILKRRSQLELKGKIAELKQAMDSLGEINFAASGEYLELREKISDMERQIKDLQDGKHSLTRMIGELDRIAAIKFQKVFQKVRTDFQEIFSLLSDGGKADLLLTEEDNLLETGIDICVIPRGKKPRHLSLLSGGEKSLAGISFLFALLQSNPSPFYLLDEIEAFLDEANLARFANFLRSWSAGYQLILISHRYQTMEIADHLYGITMEEPGISKLVSVELGQYDPEAQKQHYIS